MPKNRRKRKPDLESELLEDKEAEEIVPAQAIASSEPTTVEEIVETPLAEDVVEPMPGVQETPNAPSSSSKGEEMNGERDHEEEEGFYQEDCKELVDRPDMGCSKGSVLRTKANHFPLAVTARQAFHYDIEITRLPNQSANVSHINSGLNKFRSTNQKQKREVLEQARKEWALFKGTYPAFDGNKNIYTKSKLPLKGKEASLVINFVDPKWPDNERLTQFKIVIKPAKDGMVDMESISDFCRGVVPQVPKETLKALGVMIRHCPGLNYVALNRGFYMEPFSKNMRRIKGGLEPWEGFKQSVHVGPRQIFLNINASTSAFYPSLPLLDYIGTLLGRSVGNQELSQDDIFTLKKELKNLKFHVKHLNFHRDYNIFTVHSQRADRTVIVLDERPEIVLDGTKVFVVDYYKTHHNITLKFPMLPPITSGSRDNPTYYPIELCYLNAGQPYRKKLIGAQTSEMIKFTALPPGERFTLIGKLLEDWNNICKPIRNEFGISVSLKPLELMARKLEVPDIVYQNDSKVTPLDGKWSMLNQKFLKAISIEKWAVLSYANPQFCNQEVLQNFFGNLIRCGNSLGMTINKPLALSIPRNFQDYKVEPRMQALLDQHPDLKLIFVILSSKVDKGEIKLKIPTTCVLEIKVKHKSSDGQFLTNICQKMNTKLGGVNSSLQVANKRPEVLQCPVVVMGADVNHAAPDSDQPSIAAVVGSTNPTISRYSVSVRKQPNPEKGPRLEIIENLKEMTAGILKRFLEKNKTKEKLIYPKKIIFFRDGVGAGQFKEVKQKELCMIKKACEEVFPEGKIPLVTLVLVQKRHQTRFAPMNVREGVGGPKNVPPGTTIDKGLLSPSKFEYFQCSQTGSMGTSHPVKYAVLHDENNLSSNQLTYLTFYLCHLYARCTRSITIPAPVQYAHHAAFKGRDHLLAQINASDFDEDLDYDHQGQRFSAIDEMYDI